MHIIIITPFAEVPTAVARAKMVAGPRAAYNNYVQTMTPRDAYYAVCDLYNKDAMYKGYSFPNVSQYLTL